jgi:hypothetical protein
MCKKDSYFAILYKNRWKVCMKSIFLFTVVISIFLGCGGSNRSKDEQVVELNNQQATDNTSLEQLKKEVKKDSKTLTIYVHGYDPKGYKRVGVFGDDNYDKVIDKMVEFTEFDTTKTYDKDSKNIIAITPYYGNIAPDYYTQKDEDELKEAGEGIPRYALIIAKFAKEMLKETNTTDLNIVSASMGSLVTRYMIEKDLENLSSKSTIKKWLSLEGVITGNIGASNKTLYNIANNIEKQPYEVSQMKYSWVKENLDFNSKYYKNIDIAFESSTKDNLNNGLISKITKEANDGVQAVKDTYISGYPHTFFYENHTSLEDRRSAWGYASTFLTSSKRVKITLLSATINDLHEDRLFYGSILPAEIVFESRVYSPTAMSRWSFEEAIDERVLKSYYLPIQKYKKENISKELNQTLFDSKVLDSEDRLKVFITPYEIDFDPMYGVKEVTGHGNFESLGEASIELPLKNGIYDIRSNEYSGKIKVEVF